MTIITSHTFMQRVESSFRALHERIQYLEQRQAAQGPTDEQVERVLRKILAERFAEAGTQHFDNMEKARSSDWLEKIRNPEVSIPKSISLDAATLQVDPDAVPSKAYGQALQMLEMGLQKFPQADVTRSALTNGVTTGHTDNESGRMKQTSNDSRPWQR
jgi:hypothetical protein